MSTVLEQQQNPAAKFSSKVDEQIAQTTSRIRTHDLSFGILALAALTAFYATASILLDKYLHLSEWVRQLSLFAFAVLFAGVAFRLVVRPIRNRINPLYAASRVEQTIDDAKNSVMGYVEAQENGEVHAAVKTAMSAKAAKAVGDADINQAMDHRSLAVVGGIFVFFLLSLIVLFLIFRPTQFSSLIWRSFAPYTSDPIASRTQLALVKPDPAEATITTGQTITVAVHVGGKVPSKDSSNRLRVLMRHNQADPDFEEIAMNEGETSRDWQIKIPEERVLNGFWYKVVGGDAETPEYRVTVRSLPNFTDFEAFYHYPAYTRKADDKAMSPHIRAPRGTEVKLIAKTNRDEVKEGWMKFEVGSLPAVSGTRIPNQPNSLEFKFKVTEQTNYALHFTTTAGEKNTDVPSFRINVDTDSPPRIEITKPEEAEISIPTNGQLAVDATIGDDYGIDKVRLRLRIDGRDFAPIPYMGGQSFLRASDQTWPKSLVYKDSVDFSKLKYADGTPLEAKEGMAIEYWVEAIDNCSEVKPVPDWNNQVGNVGKSSVQKIHLTAPKKNDEEKENLDRNKGQRKNEEQQHNQAQQQKFNTEKRDQQQNGNAQKGGNQTGNDPNNASDPNAEKSPTPDPKTADKNGTNMGDPMNQNADPKNPDPKNGNSQSGGNSEPKTPSNPPNMPPANMPPAEGTGGNTDPNMPPKSQPPGGMPNPDKSTDPKGMDRQTPMGGNAENKGMNEQSGPDNNANPMRQPTPQEKKTEEQAKQVREEIEKNKRPESEAKPNPTGKPEEQADPAQQKKQPNEGAQQDSQAKEQPNPDDAANKPMTGNKSAPSESKSEGSLEKPTDPSTPKPAPPQPDAKSSSKKEEQPSEKRDEPLGGTPGQDKEQKPEGPQPKNTPKNQDPTSGSTSKPAGERNETENGKSGGSGSTEPDGKQKDSAPNAAKPKPKNEPSRGGDKNQNEPKGGSEEKKSGENESAQAKPEKATESAASKSGKKGPMMDKDQTKSESKPAPGDMNPNDPMNGASSSKPDQTKTPKGGNEDKNQIDKGTDKSEPKEGTKTGEKDPKNQDAKSGDKLDPKKLEDLKNAAKDLNNSDPKKREEARDKLDKAVGEQNRKAIEEYQKNQKEEFDKLQKDLQSPDKATREAAEKKVEDLMKQNQKNGGEQQKLDPKKLEDLKNAAKDLNNPDPKKREEARDKLDQSVGEQNRKAIEEYQKNQKEEFDQLQRDLQSSDQGKRDAAQKKLEDVMSKAKEEAKKNDAGKGQEPSPEEIADLVKKAKDLNSNDDNKRKEAEKALDDKIGKEAREKLQEELKKNMEGDPQQNQVLQKKIEEEAKKQAHRGDGLGKPEQRNGPAANSKEEPLPPIDDDPRNRVKTAELQLEEFQKNRYNKNLQDKLGWTQKEYDDFLAAQQKRLEQLQKEASLPEQQAKKPEKPAGPPTLNTNTGGKVETRENGNKGAATGSGAVFAPPGFEDAKKKFAEEAQKLLPKK